MAQIGQAALTINQPWASLIVLGIKDIENRNWLPASHVIGSRIIIHAGKTYDHLGAFMLMNDHGIVCHAQNFPRGAIVGSALLEGVVQSSSSRWFRGPYGWQFADARLIDPVPCPGSRKLWTVSPSVWERVLLADATPLDPTAFLAHESVCKTESLPFA